MPQQVKRSNLRVSVGNSSKQMQQTSGSSSCCRTDGDDFDVVDDFDVDSVVVDEVALDEVPVVVVCFLLMVCGNC